MVKCPRCGYENPSTSVYCNNCNYLLKDPNGESNKKRVGGWNMGMGKKIVLVLGIVVVAFLLFSFIHNNSQPDEKDSLNIIDANGSNYQSSTYPFRVVIDYDGSWYAQMGDPNYLTTKSSTGNGTYILDCASWDKVSVSVQKSDYGEGPLNVKLIRNGKVVAENSTTNGSSSVTLSYN
ncbi:MAG: zinc ribbon domain-containing protein [Methanobrevibacter sp.]|nr:zinc ribbon domain-containing protein [Methanobrevibacter sp.]